MKMITPISDSIFKKLNEEELLLINELYLEMEKYKNVIDKIKEYITSYESINTIQECEIPENNIGLDEETFIEMVNRYMKVHDNILELLEEVE